MSKEARLKKLKLTMENELVGTFETLARVLLWMFIKLFKVVEYYKQTSGLEKVWYIFVAIVLFIPGIVLDVGVNEAIGRLKWRDQYEFGTLSQTIQRVMNAGPQAENYDFAKQIAVVLNDYDPGHIKL